MYNENFQAISELHSMVQKIVISHSFTMAPQRGNQVQRGVFILFVKLPARM